MGGKEICKEKPLLYLYVPTYICMDVEKRAIIATIATIY